MQPVLFSPVADASNGFGAIQLCMTMAFQIGNNLLGNYIF
jgi:hypothetical protein